MPNLDLTADAVHLACALIDIPSQSHNEQAIADAVLAALADYDHLRVERFGNTIVARTDLGRRERILLGGHLDTVPSAGNLPHQLRDGLIYGLGACDMKSGVAVALRLAATIPTPNRDLTYVFYDCEEVAAEFNGLQRLADTDPGLLDADLAILMEPSNAGIEAGCQGTIRAEITVSGVRAHSARSWLGQNAVHDAADILGILRAYEPEQPVVDGLTYREGLNAVGITGGVAGNVIPDLCTVTVNYRFAPDKSLDEAELHLAQLFGGFEVLIVDRAPAARPGLHLPAAAGFVAAVGSAPEPKFGWTDVARFASLGTPALNYGPGDPALAHSAGEHVRVDQIRSCENRLRDWLT